MQEVKINKLNWINSALHYTQEARLPQDVGQVLGILPYVLRFVFFQIPFRGKPLAAPSARKRPLSRMAALVRF